VLQRCVKQRDLKAALAHDRRRAARAIGRAGLRVFPLLWVEAVEVGVGHLYFGGASLSPFLHPLLQLTIQRNKLLIRSNRLQFPPVEIRLKLAQFVVLDLQAFLLFR